MGSKGQCWKWQWMELNASEISINNPDSERLSGEVSIKGMVALSLLSVNDGWIDSFRIQCHLQDAGSEVCLRLRLESYRSRTGGISWYRGIHSLSVLFQE